MIKSSFNILGCYFFFINLPRLLVYYVWLRYLIM